MPKQVAFHGVQALFFENHLGKLVISLVFGEGKHGPYEHGDGSVIARGWWMALGASRVPQKTCC